MRTRLLALPCAVLLLTGCTAAEQPDSETAAWVSHQVASFAETGTPYDVVLGADRLWALAYLGGPAPLLYTESLVLLSSADGIRWDEPRALTDFGIPGDHRGGTLLFTEDATVIVVFYYYSTELQISRGWKLALRGQQQQLTEIDDDAILALRKQARGLSPEQQGVNIPRELDDDTVRSSASVVGPGGLIAVGAELREPDAVETAVVFREQVDDNGTRTGWERVGLPMAAALTTVVADDTGYYALSDRHSPAVWFSADGAEWQRLPGTAPAGVRAVATIGDGLLVTTAGAVHLLGEISYPGGGDQ